MNKVLFPRALGNVNIVSKQGNGKRQNSATLGKHQYSVKTVTWCLSTFDDGSFP